MPVSTWVALGALVVACMSPLLTLLLSSVKRDAKIDVAIEQLTRITADHEERLRKGRLLIPSLASEGDGA